MSTSPVSRPLSENLLIFLWDFLFSKLFFTLPKARASEHCWTQDSSPPTTPLSQGWYHLPLQRGRVLKVWAQRTVHSFRDLLPIQIHEFHQEAQPSTSLGLKNTSCFSSPPLQFSNNKVGHGAWLWLLCILETMFRSAKTPQVGSSLREDLWESIFQSSVTS